MKANMSFTYSWYRDDGKEISPDHEETLKESAESHIWGMIQQGFTSGELHDNIHMTDNDPEDGVSYRGWWEKASYTELLAQFRVLSHLAKTLNARQHAGLKITKAMWSMLYDETQKADAIIAKL